MSALQLVIGNKNYSSWSLRVWMAMTVAGLDFDETFIDLDAPETARLIGQHSKAGRVPVLRHGKLAIWELMAIIEYLAETFPDKHFWPRGKAARAMARSAANEMHGGFQGLRNECPMNLRRPRRKVAMSEQAQGDVRRIEMLWRDCRGVHGKGGKFLFGRFCSADAMFAPVVTRLDTYDIKVAPDTRAYMDAVIATPAFKTWKAAALKETWIVPSDEVD